MWVGILFTFIFTGSVFSVSETSEKTVQESNEKRKPAKLTNKTLYIKFGVSSFRTSMPFGAFPAKPVYPGITGGVNYSFWQKGIHSGDTGTNGYYIHQMRIRRFFILNQTIGYQIWPLRFFYLHCDLGAGWMHSFYDQPVYAFDSGTGQYEQKRDYGRSYFSPSMGLEMGFPFKSPWLGNPAVYIKYETFLQMPYSQINNIPVIPGTLLTLGVKIKL